MRIQLLPDRPLFQGKRLAALILPIMAEQILAAAIGMADTLMVSSCGEAVVSGVALIDSISLLLVAIFTALATGGTIVVAQYIGRGELEKANKAANQVFWVTLAISVVIAAACVLLRAFWIDLIYGEIEPDVFRSAMDYFLLIALSYPFLAQFNTCSAIFRANGKALAPMLISLLMNALNVGGNALFIYGYNMRASGAALASLVSRVVGFVFLFVLACRRSNQVGLRTLLPLRIDLREVKRILRVGLPTGLENGIFQIGKLLVQGFVTSYGTAHIAANAVASNLSNVPILICSSFGLALMTVAGQCMGAGEKEQARWYIKLMTGCAWVIIGVLGGLMLLLSSTFVGLYKLEPETLPLAETLLQICVVEAIVCWPLSFVVAYGMRAAGDVRFAMIVSIASMWLFRVGLGYVLGSVVGWKSAGILLGMGADWLFRAVLFTIRFRSGKWAEKNVI